jgi:hypothetical protein
MLQLEVLANPIVQMVLALLAGGTITATVKYALDAKRANAEIGKELRDEMRGEIDDLRSQMQSLRQSFLLERRARINAQSAAWALRKKLDMVIEMLNELREKEGMETLSLEEIPGFGVPSTEDLRERMENINSQINDREFGEEDKTTQV